MTPEAQRIAIAEVLGWRYVTDEEFFNKLYAPGSTPPIGHCCGKHVGKAEAFRGSFYWHPEIVDVVPDYLNDLNACHEMEKVLTPKQKLAYLKYLTDLDHFGRFATAAQRCEAFLRTLGLWK